MTKDQKCIDMSYTTSTTSESFSTGNSQTRKQLPRQLKSPPSENKERLASFLSYHLELKWVLSFFVFHDNGKGLRQNSSMDCYTNQVGHHMKTGVTKVTGGNVLEFRNVYI